MTLTEKTRAGFANITLRGGRITKWKGEAASCSPQLGSLVLGVSGSALAAALVMVPQAAEAGTCTETSPGSGEFICAGSVSPATPQTVSSAGPVTVTTEPGFGITTTTGTAITVTSNGELTFTDDNASTIAGVTGGLSATNNGTGEVSITTTGTLNATLGTGLRVVGGASSADMTIESATALGGQRGIYARHNGSGDLSITSTGLARGTSNDGIYARTAAAGSGLTIEAADTTGGQRGIRARHYGSEVLNVTSTGTARGTLIDGIYARNTAAGTDVTVEAYETTGGQRGIRARNYGSGDLVVISTGAARGTTLDGIYARNSANGQSMTVEANDTTGGLRGIYARNNGSDELEIISTGTARGTLATGIYARNQGTTLYLSSNNAIGGIRGIDARNNGSGTLEITSTGTATGTTAEGIYANNRGTDLTIEAADTNGGLRGISALNNGSGALAITSSGNARGTLLDGIYARNEGTDLTIESNNATGLLRGIYARNNGSGALGVTSTGTATGTVLHGIYARNQNTDLTIEAADTTGGQRGIFARNYGSGVLSITSTGTARGTSGEGIFAENTASGIGITISANDAISGTLDAYGAITGGFAGINAVNRGTAAVPAGSTGSNGLTIIANNTTGEQYGIRAINEGSGALSITSNGRATSALGTAIYGKVAGEGTDLLISARDAFGLNRGIDAANFGGGAMTIVSTGTASGYFGINAVNGKSATDITITANDTVGALAGINASLQGSGRLTISSAGFADGANNAILAQSYGSGIDIAAKDTRGAFTGIRATNLGTGAMTITSTGTAQSTTDTGIRAENGLSATDLTVNAVDVIGLQVGIRAINQGSGALTITATGTITSGEEYGQGVNARASGTSLAINVKDVTAGQYGVYANNAGSGALTITSTGLIDQTTATVDDMPLGRSGISAINGAGGTDLRIDANDVRGVVFGVRAENQGSGDLVINSTGRIEATGTAPVSNLLRANTGILAFNNTAGRDVTLAVADVAGARGGIFVDQRGTGAVSVSSTGTVTGNIGIEVQNTAASGPVTIAANTVTAGERGVLVEHLGRGDLTITSSGLIEASALGSNGIRAFNRAVDGGIIIDAADVTGRAAGVYARNYGSGGISVTSSGKLTGFISVGGATAGTGIIAQNFTRSGGGIRLDVNEVVGGLYGVSAINLGGGAVAVNATGDVTAGRGGIGASNSSNGTDLTITATNVTGGWAGIGAENRGNGILSITASGDVRTTSLAFGYGITAYSAGAGKGVVIDANNVSANLWGIRARNYGAGDTIITARGDVTGTTRAGITGINGVNTNNLTITANNTTGGRYGIEARNSGSGALAITATGLVSGEYGAGIQAINLASGTDLTISTGAVYGYTNGILASQYGSGSLTITATGTVTGAYSRGITAYNFGGTDLTINTADVSGKYGGISATNNGSGALAITVTGTASDGINGYGSGILALNRSAGTSLTINANNAAGYFNGIIAGNYGSGALTITSTGTATGTLSDGIRAVNSGTDLTIAANNTSGGTNGIYAYGYRSGAVSVTSTGTATGAAGAGIRVVNNTGTSTAINAATSTGGSNGILARHYGSGALTITSAAATGTSGDGILARNTAAGSDVVISSKDAFGGRNGIEARNYGAGALSITTTGATRGDSNDGIYARNQGASLTITASRTTGGQRGILARNYRGALEINTSGLVQGLNSEGIFALNQISGGNLTISAEDTSGATSGIRASNNSFGGALSITSTGTATGAGFAGIIANNYAGGTALTIVANNTSGLTHGIYARNIGSGPMTITSSGLAEGDNFSGIFARSSRADLTIIAKDTRGTLYGISASSTGMGATRITSTGSAIATAANGIGISALTDILTSGLAVTSADAAGGTTGIDSRHFGTGSHTITSTGDATGTSRSGIRAITNANGGNLSITSNNATGGRYGIEATNNGTGALSITATGTTRGNIRYGIYGLNRGTSLTISAGETIGGADGLRARNAGSGALTIRANGDVTGLTREGIQAINSGTDLVIEATNATGNLGGIFARNDGSGALKITSTGTARGMSFEGIAATNSVNGTDLSVASGNAMGTTIGILATNAGTGSLSVVATGTTSGTTGVGIDALNRAAGGDLTVTAADTSGGTFGIRALNEGRGALSVTSTGTAIGAGPEGILASNSAAGTSLTVNANNTSGRNNGIYVRNNGSGALSITSTGTATGRDYRGISANNSAAGTDLVVTANETRGPLAGISATNSGTGVLRITSTGSAIASGATGLGISAIGGAGSSGLTITSADASGGRVGIYAAHSGSGVLSVTSTGLASGTGFRGINVGARAGSTADIVVSSRDATGEDGILVSQAGTGSLTLTSTGLASGTRGRGISVSAGLQAKDVTVNAASASGSVNGIFVGHYGTGSLTVTATGEVTGNAAIVAAGGGTDLRVTAVNTIGANVGISASSRGGGVTEVVSTGLARATNATADAIQVRNLATGTAMSVTSRDAEGGRDGISATNIGSGALTITTTGTTTGTNRIGIDALNRGTNLTIDAGGAVTGGVDGIRARNYGTAGLTIRTSGNVTGGTGAAINAFNSANDTTASMLIEQAAGSTFTGATDGITADNAGGSLTVRALGTLVGSAGSGVNAVNQATATGMTLTVNNASGSLSGIAANNLGSGQATITLTGTAQGGTGAAIDTRSGAGNLTTITLAAGARALAGASGVAIANNEGNSALIVAPGASISGEVRLGAGNDTATFTGPNALAGITLLDGGADIDALTLNGLVGAFNPAQIANWETITFAAQSNVTATGLTIDNLIVNDSTGRFTTLAAGALTTSNAQVSLVGASTVNAISACGGALTLGGTTSVGAAGIQGCAAGESITVQDDARIAGNIVGAGGSDVIAVLGNASVAGTIFGGGAGSDNSAAADGTNTITINTTATIGAIEGGIGRDVITLTNGRVTAGVLGGDGNDAIALAGATIAGAIDGGAGDDTITLTSGSAGSVLGGDGNDIVNWNGAAATTSLVAMGAGSDTLNINAAAIGLASTTLDGGVGPAGKFDTLNLNAGWSGDLVGARVTNWDAINVNGGTIRIADAALTTGSLNIGDGGRLNASNNLVLTGNLALVSGGGLLAGNAAGNNTVNVSGNLTNGGVIDLRGPGGQTAAGDRLIIGGNYIGLAGSTLLLDAVLGGSNTSDLVVVRGNLTGSSTVVVNNVGGTGGLTSGDGIRLVQVEGASAPGALTLAGGGVDAGAFRYELFAGGIANPGRGDWFLRSRTRDVVVAAMNLARLSQDIGLTALGTMNQRIGEQEHLARQGGESGAFKGVWGRVIGKDYSAGLQSASLGDTESNGRIGGLQLGVDLWRSVAASGARTHVGVFGGQMWSSSNDVSASRIARSLGSTISDGWLVGGYVTHIAASGWYVDAVVQHDGIDHRLSGADGTRALTQSNTTLGSLEVGKAFGSVWKFEPQAQLIYASSRVDSFADSRGTATRIAIDDSLIGRGGFRLKRTWDHDENSDGGLFTIYAKANIWGRLDGGTGMLSVGTSLPGQVRMREAWGDVGIGTTFSLSRAAELFTDFEVEYGIDQGGTALAGRGGLRLRF